MMDGTKGFDDALTGEQKIRNFNINFGPQHPVAPAERHHPGDGRRRVDAAALGL